MLRKRLIDFFFSVNDKMQIVKRISIPYHKYGPSLAVEGRKML